ncbi:hypothetical protein M413DRAFT_450054 [Hebeloma cylindrosporum]|uniref:Uncharacterized protein n=1 Tax=Hebeloma cylindrosporum TaxID=76867 RepID=A0A0C2Y121_HEBCY|nr:hypothetical protein M413DRAFT_450063 [Hebeloma cylindrosporum h7]KIM34797.1 hypothetical protein M413DRAFT_450054 [Hebeloma cylindrosporum h7]
MVVPARERARSRMRVRPEPHSSLCYPAGPSVYSLVFQWIQKPLTVVVLEEYCLLEGGLACWVAQASSEDQSSYCSPRMPVDVSTVGYWVLASLSNIGNQ